MTYVIDFFVLNSPDAKIIINSSGKMNFGSHGRGKKALDTSMF